MKKLLGALAVLTTLFVVSGCDLILGGIGNELSKNPEYPTVNLDCKNDYSIHYGDEVELKVAASVSDKGDLTYQWYKGSSSDRDAAKAISGATKETYKVSGNEETVDYYWCKVTNTKNLKTVDNWTSDIKVKISNIIEVENITKATTWDATYTYFIKGHLIVSAKLTIPAGTVVKFDEDAWIEVSENGIIDAKGAAAEDDVPAKPVIFTAATDNSVGVKIPAYKNDTPEAGYWDSIVVKNQGSTFDDCVICYGGNDRSDGVLTLEAKTTVKDCTFRDNASKSKGEGALNILPDGVKSVVTGNTFYNNEWPFACNPNYTVDTSNVFHFDVKDADGKVTKTLKNTNQAINLWGGEIGVKDNVTWGITEVPYYASDNIDVYGKLTVADDVIVRFAAGTNVDVYEGGTLTLNGLFTSYLDDANGGDIFADGEDEADDGDWEGVWIEDQDDWNNSLNKDTTKVLFNDKSKYEE